jgi:hypothetical protein
MMMYKNWNDIAKGCFRRFTWELKIGEDMAGNGPCRLGQEHRARKDQDLVRWGAIDLQDTTGRDSEI